MRQPKPRRPRISSIDALAAGLPNELRTFDRWLYFDGHSIGLRDYLASVAHHLDGLLPDQGGELTSAVMAAVGLNIGDWYRLTMTGPHASARRSQR